MSEIGKVDKNLAPAEVTWAGMKTWDVNQPPFKLYGACRQPGELDYKRLPHDLPEQFPDNPGIQALYTNTAGLRLRFKTDSQKIILRCAWNVFTRFDHMPMTGVSCFDLYADGAYKGPFRPGVNSAGQAIVPIEEGYESTMNFPDRRLRDIIINFPLYNNVDALALGLEEDAQVLPGGEYTHTAPIVYGGSSITQGGCASHPGNCYQAIISRRLDTDYVNLGFSGSFRGEVAMAEYIASLDMPLFVMDYDHNAPSAAHLEQTHERMFRIFRQKHPTTPVLIISTADRAFGDTTEARKAVIQKTYDNARAAGDQNVYFLDGQTIYQEVGYDLCTVDTCHPNDLGFWCIANAIGREIQKILNY